MPELRSLVREARGDKSWVSEVKGALSALGSEDPEHVIQRRKSSRNKFPKLVPDCQRRRPDMNLRLRWRFRAGGALMFAPWVGMYGVEVPRGA